MTFESVSSSNRCVVDRGISFRGTFKCFEDGFISSLLEFIMSALLPHVNCIMVSEMSLKSVDSPVRFFLIESRKFGASTSLSTLSIPFLENKALFDKAMRNESHSTIKSSQRVTAAPLSFLRP